MIPKIKWSNIVYLSPQSIRLNAQNKYNFCMKSISKILVKATIHSYSNCAYCLALSLFCLFNLRQQQPHGSLKKKQKKKGTRMWEWWLVILFLNCFDCCRHFCAIVQLSEYILISKFIARFKLVQCICVYGFDVYFLFFSSLSVAYCSRVMNSKHMEK